MIIAVDFDGTIVENKFPKIGRELPLNPLNPKTLSTQTMRDLQTVGHQIIIWTCRYLDMDLYAMMKWFEKRGFEPNAVNSNLCEGFDPWPKVYANVYFDDRSFPPFDGWDMVRKVYLDKK